MSRFFVCKHLVSGSAVSSSQDFVRSKHPQFRVFLRQENRLFADLELGREVIRSQVDNHQSMCNTLLQSSFGSSAAVCNTTDNIYFVKQELQWILNHVDELENHKLVQDK